MRAEQPQQLPVCKRPIVNFASGELGSEDAIPQEAEQRPLAAVAQAVRALAAHAGSGSGPGDVAGGRKRVEETELTLRRPAIAANVRGLSLAHRRAWTTIGRL